ncbi:MAG: hypothetical protein RLZZ308_182 [Candidatus Parcubacteria bacterium]|jgi:uncharacterized protein
METFKTIFKNNIVVCSVLLACSLIVSASLLSKGLAKINRSDAISVTGTAERIVESDAGKWTFTITKQADSGSMGYVSGQIKEQQAVVLSYLTSQGLNEKGITVQPVVSTVVCQSQNQVMYDTNGRQQCSGTYSYALTQTFIVEADDVTRLKAITLNAQTALSAKGVYIQTVQVDFFYSKLADLRVQLLEEAAKNAKDRAEAIAKSTGDMIGGVRTASQGVFQVTQKNSTEVSDYGSYDTQTIEKKVTAIVRASFEVK